MTRQALTVLLVLLASAALTGAAQAGGAGHKGGDKGIHDLMQRYYGDSGAAQSAIYTAVQARTKLAAAKPNDPALPQIDALIASASAAVKDNSIPAGFPIPAGFKPGPLNGLFEIAFGIYMGIYQAPRETAVNALHILIGRCHSAEKHAKQATKLATHALQAK